MADQKANISQALQGNVMKRKNILRPVFYVNVAKLVLTLVSIELGEWIMALIMAIPGTIGSKIRTIVIPFKRVGKSVNIAQGGWIFRPSQITIGDNTIFNIGVLMNGGGGVDIGNNVLCGPRVVIYSQNHNYTRRTVCIGDQGYAYAKVVIEDDVWLCAGAIILPGVRVKKGTVVGAGAVVAKDTEPYSVVAGVPAVKVGQRV